LFINFFYVFDLIDHNILLDKSVSCGVSEHIAVWLEDFLNEVTKPDLCTAQHVSFHLPLAAEVLSSSSPTYGLSFQQFVGP